MFRLQDNVPDIYVNESRDFQLLCRLYDCVLNGVKSDIDTMVNINVPFKVNEKVLNLLALKVGFFTDKYIPTSLLRWIIATFPWAMRFKGSLYGIKLAVNTISKFENIQQNPIIQVNSLKRLIVINTYKLFNNTTALDEYLKYIMPTGYTYEISLIIGEIERVTITNPNELLYFNTIPTALALDSGNDSGYLSYASYKIEYELSEASITSIKLTSSIDMKTLQDGDYIGIGSIIETSPKTFINKTIYYGDDNFPTSIPANSIIVNSRLAGEDYPTSHVSEPVYKIVNDVPTDELIGIKTVIAYYVTNELTFNESVDTNDYETPDKLLTYTYYAPIPLIDINRFNNTILTTQVSGLEDELVYILSQSGEKPADISLDTTKYTLVYNIADNKWWEYKLNEWVESVKSFELNYTNDTTINKL